MQTTGIEFGYDHEYQRPWFGHYCITGWQEGMLPNGEQGWEVIQRVPLTLEPSLSCADCGIHGRVEKGMWQTV